MPLSSHVQLRDNCVEANLTDLGKVCVPYKPYKIYENETHYFIKLGHMSMHIMI